MPDDEKRRVVMEAQVEATAEAVADIAMRVSAIDNGLRGNGKSGLFTEFAVLKTRVRALEDFTSEVKHLRRWMTLGVLALLGSVSWATVEWVMRTGG